MRFEFVPLLRSSTGRLKSGAAQAQRYEVKLSIPD
jgi:hypothetical protein